jgi:glutamate-ammonia-ligase adenylyltransferase
VTLTQSGWLANLQHRAVGAGKPLGSTTGFRFTPFMPKSVWPAALKAAPDPQRAAHYFEKLRATAAAGFLKRASVEQARVVAALLSGSQALSELLLAHPDWAERCLKLEWLQHARQPQGLRRELEPALQAALAAQDHAAALAAVREWKQCEQLRIAARDLAGLAPVAGIIRELSDVADVGLDATGRVCWQQLTGRFGTPFHLDAKERWQPTAFCVMGLGKLGGQELNYSSDVDVMFIYSEEGFVFKSAPRGAAPAGRGLASHQFFKRLAEAFIAEVSRLAPEGALYRIDLRLRPEGDQGPLARSLASYENYYAQWGQTWERMMLIKARGVAGDRALAAEFLEMINPFRYPRSLPERTLPEIAAMKRRIENEVVKAGELERDVKRGRGGIREIEFIAQSLQLVHAGRMPFLQNPQTLPALEHLARYQLLPREEAGQLAAAYAFLRNIEHRLQMENNRQTHAIPTERKARERLSALMGFASLAEFEKAHRRHRDQVRGIYDSILKADEPEPARAVPAEFAGAEAEWRQLLAGRSFREPDKAFRLAQTFALGPGYGHVSARTTELALQLLARLIALCPETTLRETPGPLARPVLSDPDRVLARLDSFVSRYGARAMLYESWAGNPSLFELLVWLFDRSEFLAEVAIRTPDLVDDLEQSGMLRRRKTATEILADLRHGLGDRDQHQWLRRYHQVEFMRLGLRDILGLVDFEQNLVELSALAEACLQYALEVITRKRRLKRPPFTVIGLGKLGGAELTYGSDLDVMFVADDAVKNLAGLQPLAVELMDLLAARTEAGAVFVLDARLRPDGEKGLLVNTLGACEDYYRRRAQLWEIQALTRTRPMAGDAETGGRFQAMVRSLTDFDSSGRAERKSGPWPAAFTADWRREIARMRQRIERERMPSGKDALAIKTGAGGLMDAEFIAQTLCLARGWQEPNTLRALERAQAEQALTAADAEKLLPNYRALRRVEGILRRWSFEGEVLLPDDPAPMYRVAVRCGYTNAAAFTEAVAGWRRAIREVYQGVLPAA